MRTEVSSTLFSDDNGQPSLAIKFFAPVASVRLETIVFPRLEVQLNIQPRKLQVLT